MLPLCTRVTWRLSPSRRRACWIALRTWRWLPCLLTGLMPMPDPSRILALAQLGVGGDHHLVEVFAQLLADGVIGCPLNAHVDVFGVFPINDHVQILGTLVGTGGAAVVAAGTHAGIQIKDLTQGHVQRTDAAADRRGQRAFDGDAEALESPRGCPPAGTDRCRRGRRLHRRRTP